MKNPTNIHLRMQTAEGRFVDRTIDISNLYVHRGDTTFIETDKYLQKDLLNEWIKLRGNDQHATILTLISWGLS